MLNKDTVGIWCRQDKAWYYLETGGHTTSSNVDRVKRVLIARGLITYRQTGPIRNEEPYKIMPYPEAQERGYEIKPIYLNAHIKSQMEAEKKHKEQQSPWTF